MAQASKRIPSSIDRQENQKEAASGRKEMAKPARRELSGIRRPQGNHWIAKEAAQYKRMRKLRRS